MIVDKTPANFVVPGSVDVPDLIVKDCAVVLPLTVELAVLKPAID